MIKYDYAHEKFHEAVKALAISDLPLGERLLDAFVHIRALDDERHMPEDMPKDLRNDFQNLRESRIVGIMERIDHLYCENAYGTSA